MFHTDFFLHYIIIKTIGLKKYDIELRLPIRHVSSNAEIEVIVGEDWEEGDQQLRCVLSGNYQDPNGDALYSEDAIKLFYKDHALKLAEGIVERYLKSI